MRFEFKVEPQDMDHQTAMAVAVYGKNGELIVRHATRCDGPLCPDTVAHLLRSLADWLEEKKWTR